jgi:dynactin-2
LSDPLIALQLEKNEEISKQAETSIDPANIVEELSQLQKMLQKTIEDEKIRGIIDPKVEIEMAANLQTELSKKLLAELQSYVNKPPQSSQEGKDSITYELFYKPDQAKHMQTVKLADLEKRISELEQLLGAKYRVPFLLSFR